VLIYHLKESHSVHGDVPTRKLRGLVSFTFLLLYYQCKIHSTQWIGLYVLAKGISSLLIYR